MNIFIKRSFWSVFWFISFCITPLVYNIISFSFIISFLKKKAKRERSSGYVITIVKAILTTFFFTISWIPAFCTVVILDDLLTLTLGQNLILTHFFYLNTITDPLVYLIPNAAIRRVLLKVYQIKSMTTSVARPTSVVRPSSVVRPTSVVSPPSVVRPTSVVSPPSVVRPSSFVSPPSVVKPTSIVSPPSVVRPSSVVSPTSVVRGTNVVSPDSVIRPTNVDVATSVISAT